MIGDSGSGDGPPRDGDRVAWRGRFLEVHVAPYGDGGQLFKEACFTWVMGVFVAYAHRQEIFALAARFGLPVPAPRAG